MVPEWGALLATGSKDGTARLWRVMDGRCVLTLRGHLDSVNAVAFSSEEYFVATASSDSTAKVWSTLTGKVLCTFAEHNHEVLAVTFSPDGSKVMTGGQDRRALIWAAADAKWVKPGALQPHSGAVTSVAWAPRGHQADLMLTGSRDKNARTWNSWGAEAKVFSGHEDEVTGVAWAPDGSTVATASEQGCAKLWQWGTGTCIATCEGHEDAVTSVAYSPDSRCIATGSADGCAKVWTLHAECVMTLRGHSDEVTSVAFSPDGTYLATASLDGTARVWDMGTGVCVQILRGHEDGLTSVTFQPRDKVVPVPILPPGNPGGKEDMSVPEALQPKNHHEDYKKDPQKWLDDL